MSLLRLVVSLVLGLTGVLLGTVTPTGAFAAAELPNINYNYPAHLASMTYTGVFGPEVLVQHL